MATLAATMPALREEGEVGDNAGAERDGAAEDGAAQDGAEVAVVVFLALSGKEVFRGCVLASSPVRDLRRQLVQASGIPVAAQWLIHKGVEVPTAKSWRELGAKGPFELALVCNTAALPSYEDLEKRTFNGRGRRALPAGACSEGNAARSITVWLKNGRGGSPDNALGWTVFGQGVLDNGKMFTVCARGDETGMGVWGHYRDVWLEVGNHLWPKGEWHHLAVTWDGRDLTMYYDGEELGKVGPATSWSRTEHTFSTDSTQAFLGGGPQACGGNPHMKYFLGETACLRVWNSTCIDQSMVRDWMDEDLVPGAHGLATPTVQQVREGAHEEMPGLGIPDSVELAAGALPSYTDIEKRAFDGASRLALPSGACSQGNAARSVLVWLKNGRSGGEDERLGWTVFGQGILENGKMFTVCARGDPAGMGVWGHYRDVWLRAGSLWGNRKWHHLAITWDGHDLTVYYDGEPLGRVGPDTGWARTETTFDTDPCQAFFGGGVQERGGNPHMKYFKGHAAGFRVWNSTCIDHDTVRHWMVADSHLLK